MLAQLSDEMNGMTCTIRYNPLEVVRMAELVPKRKMTKYLVTKKCGEKDKSFWFI